VASEATIPDRNLANQYPLIGGGMISIISTETTMMEANAKEFYDETVRTLPPKERLRLAAMILNDLTNSDDIDFSDCWSDQDIQDLTTFALSHSENPHEPKKKEHP
jgi:hypothetical protein